uniref:Chloroplast plastocyanin n=1 Tax=Karlodinium veneficum TaxID=407301 RepID=A3E3X8_KARVE|nr:chloroplast plastocyanin [Karlodinium veneficum]
MHSNGLECAIGEQNTYQGTQYGKRGIVVAALVGMLVGALCLAGASSLGPAVNSTRKFAAAPVGAPSRTSASQALRSVSPILSDALDTNPEALKLDPEAALDKAGADFCSRRNALGRAAAAAAAMIGAPALVSAGATVKMGTDSGALAFEPKDITVCAGDTVTWTMNKNGPHNVLFSEAPDGFETDDESMEGYLSEVGSTWSKKLDIAGTYNYLCQPHKSGGMVGSITVN